MSYNSASDKRNKGYVDVIYANGCVELRLKESFPCKVAKARKLFPVINQYCLEEDKDLLHFYLREYIRCRTDEIESLEAGMKSAAVTDPTYESYKNKLQKVKLLKRRAVYNIKLLKLDQY